MKTNPRSCLQVTVGLGLCCVFAASFTNQHHVGYGVPRKPHIKYSTSPQNNRWTVGDVEEDFERLERAIKLETAPDELLLQTRVEMMDFMASSRKEVSAKILSLMRGPLLTSLLLTLAFNQIARSRTLAVMNLLSCLQFSVCVVMAPLLLLTIQSRKSRHYKTVTLPRELQGIGEHYLRFLTFYENPKLSCKDSVLCLLELWSFAVLPGLLYRPLSLPRRLVTRLASAASLRQYPAQSYELWNQQRYPLTGIVVALRTFAKLTLPTTMFIIDASFLMARLRPELVMRWYAIMYMFGTISYFGFKHIKPKNKTWNMIARLRAPLCLLGASLALRSILIHPQAFAGVAVKRYMPPLDARVAFSKHCLMEVLGTILATLSCAGALWNLVSIQGTMRLAFTHNFSLSTCLDDDCSTRANAFEDRDSFQWRYWYTWREPERISQSLRSIGSRCLRWVFLEGTVDEQRLRARRERKLPILALLKNDEFNDRAQWKIQAMNNVAEYHRSSINDGSVGDPLGCAIYESFAIGLGFAFDHMTPPANETRPSTRQLQARAAKSAQKRAVELFDAEGARNELARIQDPELRKKRRRDILRPQSQNELDYMARRLTELIPRSGSLSLAEIDKEQSVALYYKLLSRIDRCPTVERLLREYIQRHDGELGDAGVTVSDRT